jgi:hypothetical protein
MDGNGSDLDRRRRKLLKEMEWVFVYAPVMLAVLVALLAGAFIAWIVQVPGTNFWGRWAIAALLIIAIPAAGQLIKRII